CFPADIVLHEITVVVLKNICLVEFMRMTVNQIVKLCSSLQILVQNKRITGRSIMFIDSFVIMEMLDEIVLIVVVQQDIILEQSDIREHILDRIDFLEQSIVMITANHVHMLEIQLVSVIVPEYFKQLTAWSSKS